MAKKLAKKKATPQATAAQWARAVPCFLVLIIGFAVMVLLLYAAMSSSGK
jgi:hypothetical protein